MVISRVIVVCGSRDETLDIYRPHAAADAVERAVAYVEDGGAPEDHAGCFADGRRISRDEAIRRARVGEGTVTVNSLKSSGVLAATDFRATITSWAVRGRGEQ